MNTNTPSRIIVTFSDSHNT